MIRTDLNLLVVLDSLLDECSVSKTAKRLNVTPPAVSKSLNKIRDVFQDQILVRSGSKLILTPLAVQLKPQVRGLINSIENLFNININFNIEDTSLVFTIASNDLIISLLNYHFLKRVKNNEPNLIMDFIYDNGSQDFLRKDNIDLYIGEPRKLSPEIKIRTIYREGCYIIARKGHSILGMNKTIDNIAKFGFITTKGKQSEDVDATFVKLGHPRKVVGISPSYFSTIETLLQTDALAIVPGFFLDALERLNVDVVAFEPQCELPKITIVQAWHPRHDNSPAHKWLRDYTKEFFTPNQVEYFSDSVVNKKTSIG